MSAKESFDTPLRGRINHSVCRWCYEDIPLEIFYKSVKALGLSSVELLGPEEWPTLKEYGLTCAMPWGADKGISDGFNDPDLHAELADRYGRIIPMVAEAGFDKIICFSGDRKGLGDETGLKNCEAGLKKILPVAEKYGVIVCMELLNSKIDHPDYQCDYTPWGIELCDTVGSEHFKLLYDIYHMQIMEGDVIRTIRDYHEYFAHYHTGGVPGRNEIDQTQEIYYPAVMKTIVETGYTGFVAQEFVPTWDNQLTALKHGVDICDV